MKFIKALKPDSGFRRFPDPIFIKFPYPERLAAGDTLTIKLSEIDTDDYPDAESVNVVGFLVEGYWVKP